MSRYRKIEVRTWADERFRRLSPIQPSGQGLWFFLLTGPHTGPIPGLFRAGRAAMAEELDWDVEAFDKAFHEVFEKGMAKADFKARLVWLPNALNHNKPESPNVVRSWRIELDILPECDLKNEAIAHIREILESIGPSYVQAFDEVRRKPSPKASVKPSAKAMPNQEQEQEQEQEQNQERDETPPWGRTQVDPGFVADEPNRRTAIGLGLDVEAERERFVAHYTATGDWRANWQSQFRKWLLDSMQHKASRAKRASAKPSPGARSAEAAQRWLDSEHADGGHRHDAL